METIKKITKARAGLVLSSPFFASVALHLKLKEDSSNCETAYTDSVVLGYNPEFVNNLTNAELKAVICHEVLHIAMLHPFRRNNRDHLRWNIACDYAINPIVKDAGFSLPAGALLEDRYKGKEAEVIYNMLPKQLPSPINMIGEVKDYKQDKQDKNSNTAKQQEKNWKITLTGAAAIAKAQGKLPAGLDRMIQEILQPKLPWREILSRFITENAKNDYTWTQPNKRYLYSGLYLPALNVPTLGTIAIIIDTSGSISQKELDTFASELQAILSIYPGTEIKVIYVDTKVANTETIDIYDFKLHAKGGGGTDFKPGFDYIEQEAILPSCVIYFTDGYCDSFPESPDYPTLWVLTDKANFKPPFGEMIYMEQRD
ncbi:MAG: VWA-like domain-containing protein [Candidatus Cloacimonetes bacterium]|jgi:predicted metal-dependent peptidase|nr:VWA-like domain-containing protein [Candidatus Cloacimonadota bacterium]